MRNHFPDQDQLLARLKQIIADNFRLSENQVNNIRLDEPLIGGNLGFDSLDALELAMYVEEEFGIALGSATETRAALGSIASLADFIRSRLRVSPAFSTDPVSA